VKEEEPARVHQHNHCEAISCSPSLMFPLAIKCLPHESLTRPFPLPTPGGDTMNSALSRGQPLAAGEDICRGWGTKNRLAVVTSVTPTADSDLSFLTPFFKLKIMYLDIVLGAKCGLKRT
jgi:hypothetical protein